MDAGQKWCAIAGVLFVFGFIAAITAEGGGYNSDNEKFATIAAWCLFIAALLCGVIGIVVL